MRVLITGIAGFAGSHLVEYLLTETNWEVGGVVRPSGDRRHIAHLLPQLKLFPGDVSDHRFLAEAFAEWRPDYVVHLAAQSAPSLAWSQARETLTTNVVGQYNVLEAVARVAPEAVVLVVGSGDEYGVVHADELPVTENNPLRPNSPYAVSKVTQDMLGYQFFVSRRLHTVRVRPFNHIGPRQGEAFVTASFARQIAEIEVGKRPAILTVGNLEARRDFCDVRDVVRAYHLALVRGIAGEVYNIGSGVSHRVSDLLYWLLQETNAQISVERDEARFRPSDVPDLVCDASKFREHTGWSPTIAIENSLADVLDYWRDRVREG